MDQYRIENGILMEYIPEDYEADEMCASVPEGVTIIGETSFQYFPRLKSVKLPEGVKEIEGGAFFECTNLETINFPDSLESIGDEAFGRCYKMANDKGLIIVKDVIYGYIGKDTEIIIDEGIKAISARAFAQRTNLKSIHLPASLTRIGDEAFYECENLESINLEHVQEIGEWAFKYTNVKK